MERKYLGNIINTFTISSNRKDDPIAFLVANDITKIYHPALKKIYDIKDCRYKNNELELDIYFNKEKDDSYFTCLSKVIEFMK